eukprot:g80406.t1
MILQTHQKQDLWAHKATAAEPPIMRPKLLFLLVGLATLCQSTQSDSLYSRLGGYDAIVAFANDALQGMQADSVLARFWENRGADGVQREKQLLIDHLVHITGGPLYYTGRSMPLTHRGMGITEEDWTRFMGYIGSTAKKLGVGPREGGEVVSYLNSIKKDVVDDLIAAEDAARSKDEL